MENPVSGMFAHLDQPRYIYISYLVKLCAVHKDCVCTVEAAHAEFAYSYDEVCYEAVSFPGPPDGRNVLTQISSKQLVLSSRLMTMTYCVTKLANCLGSFFLQKMKHFTKC